MPVLYPIRAAAKATGITVDTLRAWERRYQAVAPGRTDRGRLYKEADISRLLLLRRAVESGRAIGQVATLSNSELRELSDRSPSHSGEQEHLADTNSTVPSMQRLLESIRSYDSTAVSDELGRLALLLRPEELVHKVVLPLMRLAGENWEKGIFQIAHEHMLSACVRNLLGGMVRLQRAERRAGRLMLTTPSGELHEFGILAAAMLAVAHNFEVAYLGPNLPVREILFAAGKSAPRAVVLGIMKLNAPAVRKDVRRLAASLPAGTELWVGGSGAQEIFDGEVRGGVFALGDMKDFERHLVRLRVTPAPD